MGTALLPSTVCRLPAVVLFFLATAVFGQTRGAEVTKQQKPVYPDGPLKGQRQGNVDLIGRIDTAGKIRDIRVALATLDAFIDPGIDAVNAWQLRPALRAGKPVEIAANIGLRYRLQVEKHGDIGAPILGDLSVFPADASGGKKAPDGFPIKRGEDPRLRVEAVLDVTPQPKARPIAIIVQAISPKARRIAVFEGSVTAPAKASEVNIRFNAPIGGDWEDGVWLLRFLADKAEAGGGQFWLAGDPEHFHFVMPGKPRVPAPTPRPAVTPPPAIPKAAPKKK